MAIIPSKTFISDDEMSKLEQSGKAANPGFVSDSQAGQFFEHQGAKDAIAQPLPIQGVAKNTLNNIANVGEGFIDQFGGAGAQDLKTAIDPRTGPVKAPIKFAEGLGKAAWSDISFLPKGIYSTAKNFMTEIIAPGQSDLSKSIDAVQFETGKPSDPNSMSKGFLTGAQEILPFALGLEGVDDLPNKTTGFFKKSAANADIVDVVKPKLSAAEEAKAKASGRGDVKGITRKVKIDPTKTEVEMGKYAKEAGVKPGNNFAKNIDLMKKAQENSAKLVRDGLKKADAVRAKALGPKWQAWVPDEVSSELGRVERPLTIKSDPALARLAKGFDKAVTDLSTKLPKTGEGLLDLRQGVDRLIEKEFPANIYTKDTPIGQYVKAVRRALNDFTESKLPDGKLPGGSTFKGELRRQSLLYDAIDNVADKAPKEGSTGPQRFSEKHPKLIKGLQYGGAAAAGAVGVGGAVAGGKKLLGQ